MEKSPCKKCFRYGCVIKTTIWFSLLGSILLVVFALFLVISAIYAQMQYTQFNLTANIIAVFSVIITFLIFILTPNSTPDICIDNEYLYVNFFFRPTKARLADIEKVKTVLIPNHKQAFVILFKEGLTPCHRFYGWIYARSFLPGIFVGPTISNRDELEGLLTKYLR